MRMAAGLHSDPLGELAVITVRGKGRRKAGVKVGRDSCTNAKAKYSSSVVPPDPSVHFYHWEKGKKRVWNRDGRNRREGVGRDGKGREVENGEGSSWIFVEGRRVASDASATEADAAVTATSRLTIRSLRRLLEIYRLSAGGRKR